MAERGTISELYDLTSMDGQHKAVLEKIMEYVEAVKKASDVQINLKGADTAKGISSGLSELEKTSAKLIETEKKLAAAQAELSAAMVSNSNEAKKQGEGFRALNSDLNANIQKQAELKARLKEVQEDIKKLSAFKGAAANSKEFADEMANLTAEQAQLKVQIQATNKFITNQTKDFLAAEGSIDQLRAKINQLNQSYDALSEDQRSGDVGQGLLKQIQEIDKELKDLEGTTGRFQRNVGNYANSLAAGFDAVTNEIRRVQQEKDALEKSFQQRTKAGFVLSVQEQERLNQTNASLTQLNKIQNLGRDTTIGFTQKVKILSQEYQNLVASGNQSNEFLQEFKKFVADAKDQTEDLKAEIKALSSDTFVFDQIASGMKTATAAFQVGAGVAELFGDENKDIQKSIQKLIIIQNVANGVQEIANQLTLRGSIINRGYVFIQNLMATAFDRSAASAARFNAALGLIGIAVTVIGAIAIAMAAYKKSAENAATAQSLLQKTLKDSNSEYTKAVKEVESLRINIDLAKKGFLDKKDVVTLYNDTIGKTTGQVKTLDEAEKALTKNGDAYIEMTLLKAAANLALEEAAAKALQIEKNRLAASTGFAAIEEGGVARAEALKQALKDPEYQRLTKEAEEAFFKSGVPKNATAKQKEAAKVFLDQSRSLFAQRDKIVEDLITKSRNKELVTEVNSLQSIAGDFQKRAAEISSKFKFSFFGNKDDKSGEDAAKKAADAEFEIFKIRQQRKINIQKEEAENDKANILSRLFSIQKFVEESKILIDAEAAHEKTQKGITAKEVIAIDEKKYDKLIEVRKQASAIFLKIQEQERKEEEKERKRIEEERKKLQQEQTVSATNRFSKASEDVKLLNELHKVELGLIEEKKKAYRSLYQEVASTISTILGGIFDAEKNRLQDQIDKTDELKNKEIERASQQKFNADGSIRTEEEKAARIKIIEAKAQADKEALQRKQRQADRQKAIFERVFKSFQITTSGIESVAKIKLANAEINTLLFKAIASGNPALIAAASSAKALAASQIPFSIGTTALQLAALLAVPLPRFKGGKNMNSYQGFGWVDDGGKPEAIIRENGDVEIGTSKPRITWLDKNDIVLPDKNMLPDYAVNMTANNYDKRVHATSIPVYENSPITTELKGMRKELVAIKNKPSLILDANEGGLVAMWKHGATQVKYINDQTNWNN